MNFAPICGPLGNRADEAEVVETEAGEEDPNINNSNNSSS